MLKSLLTTVVFAGLAAGALQPAQAAVTLADYSVYATGSAYISGGSYGAIASGSFTNANGPRGTNFISNTASSTLLDSQASALSQAYAQRAATGVLSVLPNNRGKGTFTGTSSGINVFTLDAAQYASLYALSFAGPGMGAIVNVTGDSFDHFINIDFGSLASDQVVFNFVDASSVTMGGMNIQGSILAPDALVTLRGGSVAGVVVADRFYSEGTRIGGDGFAGFAQTPPVPEPATWALMLLGFGLVGAAIRRRRTRKATSVVA